MDIKMKNEKGLTAIEGIIALAVILLIGAGLYQAFSSNNDEKENNSEDVIKIDSEKKESDAVGESKKDLDAEVKNNNTEEKDSEGSEEERAS